MGYGLESSKDLLYLHTFSSVFQRNAYSSFLFPAFALPLHRFEVPGEPTGLHLSQAWDNVPGFQYQGTGLNDGQCGVVIKHVKLQNHGIVRCMLGTNDGQELIGQVPLTVASKRICVLRLWRSEI